MEGQLLLLQELDLLQLLLELPVLELPLLVHALGREHIPRQMQLVPWDTSKHPVQEKQVRFI